jgi:hypothetical protein
MGTENSRQVWFNCWEAKKETDRTRLGSFLGTLPLLGDRDNFLIPLPRNSPYTQELEIRYPTELKKARFDCAVQGGNILFQAEQNQIRVQCYFQAGAILVDINGDFQSDGEVAKGAGVDTNVGTFPVSGKYEDLKQ